MLKNNSKRNSIDANKRYFYVVILLVVAVSVVFRLSNLEGKVYWHDETFTGLFATGHNPSEVEDVVLTGPLITAQQIQSLQTYSPERGM